MSLNLCFLRNSLKLRSLLLQCRFDFYIYALCQRLLPPGCPASLLTFLQTQILFACSWKKCLNYLNRTLRGQVLAILADGLEHEYTHLGHSAGSACCSSAMLLGKKKKSPAQVFFVYDPQPNIISQWTQPSTCEVEP